MSPGHTPEHLCFLVTDRTVSDRPIGMATGDFIFVGEELRSRIRAVRIDQETQAADHQPVVLTLG